MRSGLLKPKLCLKKIIIAHFSKSLIFVQKVNFGLTLWINAFEFLRQNWKAKIETA